MAECPLAFVSKLWRWPWILLLPVALVGAVHDAAVELRRRCR